MAYEGLAIIDCESLDQESKDALAAYACHDFRNASWVKKEMSNKIPTIRIANRMDDEKVIKDKEREEIVRCMNCKKRFTQYCLLSYFGIQKLDDWFCADGDRR